MLMLMQYHVTEYHERTHASLSPPPVTAAAAGGP
jgi:hypothetical protein